MSNSGLTPYQDEVLTILMEECGETVQEICKIFRFGMDAQSYHVVGDSHAQRLESELGDIMAMMKLLVDSNIGITPEGLERAAEAKLIKVAQWMKHKPESVVVTKPTSVKRRKPRAKKTKKEIDTWKEQNL